MPVRLTPGGPIGGVVEVYRDYQVIQTEIDRWTHAQVSLGLGLLVMYVLLLPVMVGTNKTLRRQNEQLTDQAYQLRNYWSANRRRWPNCASCDRMKGDFVSRPRMSCAARSRASSATRR